MTLASALKKKNATVYQQVAEQYGVTARYVGKIARSERIPTKKTGLKIKQELELRASQNN
jgi:transcriptional regulator with XRE-family HTH domain